MRAASSSLVGDGYEGEGEGEKEGEGSEMGVGWVKGVVGMGMLAAISWRSEKSVGRRPRGIEGGQRRWRLGVEGRMFSWSWEGLSSLSSETDLRRFREVRGGVCGCEILLVSHCCRVCGRDCFLEWALVPAVSAMGLASWGCVRNGREVEEGVVEGRFVVMRDWRERHAL